MHIRRNILQALRTQLQALPGFGGVWIQRIGPGRNAYPCITLYAEAETVEHLTFQPTPRPQERVVTVAVNIWIRGVEDDEKAEIDMDDFAVVVEGVLVRPALASGMSLIATDFKVSEEEPEIHALTLTYQISYFSTEFSPTV